MKKANAGALDIKLQAAILALGQLLTARPSRAGTQARAPNPEAVACEVERVLAQVRASPARRLLGVLQNFATPQDPIRLKALAVVGWEMVSEVTPSTCIETVAAAIVDSTQPLCEQLLVVRDVLGRMVGERLLTLSVSGNGWSGRLLLPPGVFSWLVGGAKSHGDFNPAKTDMSRLNRDGAAEGTMGRKPLPTARQLYEAVRKDVIGLDPQLRVLASRFCLHAIRAEAVKAGADCTEVPQMVVVLISDSGAGKSFTVSRLAKHIGGLAVCQYDSTLLTAQGYVGADLDEPYRLLVNSAGGDVDEASRGVIFLDEASAKSTKYNGRDAGRDVSTLAIQQELLCKLQANAPFVVGGKRQFDTRPFLFDGRRTGYILGGTFDGLDEAIGRMEGRRGIGFASEAGSRRHVTVLEGLKSLGFLDALVNRISAVIRLPTPGVAEVERALVNIVNGFDEVLLPRGIALLPDESAVRMIAGYAVESRGYYRAAKAVLAVIVEDLLFEERGGGVGIRLDDVRRAIERLTSGIVRPDAPPAAYGADAVPYGDAPAEQAAGG